MARSTGAHTKAWGTATYTARPNDADTIIVGNVTYRFKDTLAQANDVKRGADLNACLESLVHAINGTGTSGTDYFAGTSTVPAVVATENNTVLTLTARLAGTHANGIELREGTDVATAYSITRVMSGGAGNLTTFLSDLRTLNQINSEVISEIDHVQNAAAGA